MVNGLLERFLQEAEQRPPNLADIIGRLRAIETLLRAKGVVALFVFGSVARGDARPDSDVDLAVDFATGVSPSLFEIVRLKEELEAALGRQVDVGERAAMTERVAATAKSELIRVF